MKLIAACGNNLRAPYLVCLLLTVMTLSVYRQVKDFEFINYDDSLYVAENRVVQTGLNLKSVWWAITTTEAANWHPFTWISHLLDVQLYGMEPGLHHRTNLLIHIVNTILLFLSLRGMTGALWRSALVAALFALHPLHVELVAQVACRKDLLSTFFWLLTLMSYARYVAQPGKLRYMMILVFFASGLLAKPMLVTLPFVFLLLDYWPLKRFSGIGMDAVKSTDRWAKIFLNLLWEKIPLFILTIVSSAVTFWVQNIGGAVASLDQYPLSVRVANALVSYTRYIYKTIWPVDMTVFYPHPGMWPLWQVLGAFFLLAFITLAVLKTAKNHPYACVGWLWYLGTLVPVIGLVQVGVQAMADRYTYVPIIGLFVMVTWGVDALLKGWRYHVAALAATMIAVLSILMTVTWIQTNYWQSSFKLFTHALEVTSDNYIAHNNMGIALHQAGRPEAAIQHYRQSLQINPAYAPAHNNWGNALFAIGKSAEAAEHYTAATEIDPRYAEAYYNRGNCLLSQKRIDEAARLYLAALRINPYLAKAHNNLGTALALQGKIVEAISHYRNALSTEPAFFEPSKNLAILYSMQGNYDAARSILKESIAARPEQWEASYYIAGTYARQGKIEESLRWLEKAVGEGFSDWELLRADLSLEMIRATAYYQELIRNH